MSKPVLTRLCAICLWLIAAAAIAQPPKVIYASTIAPAEARQRVQWLEDGLKENGLISGRDYVVEVQAVEPASGTGRKEALLQLASRVVAARPAVIFAPGLDAAAEVARIENRVPIVFAGVGDPTSPTWGLIANPERPERNVTGVTEYINLVGMRMQLLKQAFPHLDSVALVYDGKMANSDKWMPIYRAHAERLKLTLKYLQWTGEEDLERLSRLAAEAQVGALVVLQDSALERLGQFLQRRAEEISPEQRSRYAEVRSRLEGLRVPAIFPFALADHGALMHYVPLMSPRERFSLAAAHVARILRGTPVAELPIVYPTAMDFAVNLQTLKKHGWEIASEIAAGARLIER